MSYRRIAALKTADQLRAYLQDLGIDLPFDESLEAGPDSPLAQPYRLSGGFTIGNRFCAQPMEGWDGTPDGKPTELTVRRWRKFGRSGAKLIWGGEAVAVRQDGRANPNQLLIHEATWPDLARLRRALVEEHERHFASSADLLVGLQLTHSGRFSKPNKDGRPEPTIAYHHPLLDARLGLSSDSPLISDARIEQIIQDFIAAAELAAAAGFAFVDIKLCHGYLGHELLSAHNRPGKFGGSFENRVRFAKQVITGIHKSVPMLPVGVRLSAFDLLPFSPDPLTKIGVPVKWEGEYPYAFGVDPCDPLRCRLDETIQLLGVLQELGVELVNLSAGSPYYNPHIQRPALFPPSDGYLPPEDPLVGVARQIEAVAQIKRRFPRLLMVGSAYSYLQEWLPNVAQYNVRNGRVDFVGLGRVMLSYPELPADVLGGKSLDHRRICRTFSDCTTAPRNGLVSGCYPLDDFYKSHPDAIRLKISKAKKKASG